MTRSDAELLTLDQAAARLGLSATDRPWRGKSRRAAMLLAAVLSREAELSRPILHRRRGAHRTTLRVTMHSLREHLPELFPGTRTRLADEGTLRQMLRSFDTRLDERLEGIEHRVEKVDADGRVTRRMVFEVAQRLCRLVGADSDPAAISSEVEEIRNQAASMPEAACRQAAE